MKKGFALNTTVAFIAGLVFLVLVIFALIHTGIFSIFREQMSVLFCTFSVYSRGTIMRVIETIIPYLLAMFIILTVLSAGKTKKTDSILQIVPEGGRLVSGFSPVRSGGILAILIGTLILFTVSNIPLFCTTNSIDAVEIYPEEFANLLGSRSIDTFNTFGGGSFNPLWGLEPNPRTFFIVYFELNEETNMSYILEESYEKYEGSWPFGNPENDMNLHLYCPNYKENIEDWEDCEIEKGIIYIMYLDKVPYDVSDDYSSGLCNMKMLGTFDTIDRVRDHDFVVGESGIVWCVQSV